MLAPLLFCVGFPVKNLPNITNIEANYSRSINHLDPKW